MTKASALVQRWPSTSQMPCMCLGWNERTRTLTFSSDKISKLETEHLSLPNNDYLADPREIGKSWRVHGLNDLGIEVELDLYNDIQ